MKYVFVFFGNYGAGKTYLSKAITNNVVALASPIRSIAFNIFKDDKFYSTKQEDKDAPINVPKVIPKPRNMKQAFYDSLMGCIDDFPKTYRGMLQAVGKVGRDISKNYWAEKAKETIESLLETQEIVCIDDLRYHNELKILNKIKNVKIIPIFVDDGNPLEGYELEKILKTVSPIVLKNFDKARVTIVGELINIETPTAHLRKCLEFLTSS